MVSGGTDIKATTIGTGVTEIQLNGAVSVIVPDPVREICDAIMYNVPNAAYTAGQALLTQIRMSSPDIKESIEPKRWMADITQGGLSTLFNTFVPPLHPVPLNIKTKGGERVNVYGTSQVANTVAPLVGGTLYTAEQQKGLAQYFYEKPDNETLTGTTVDTRTAGNAISVSGVKGITKLFFVLGNLVQTVSESVAGTVEFSTSDLNTVMTQVYAIQPGGAFLGATASIVFAKNTEWALTEPIMPNKNGTLTINNWFTNRIVFTAAGNFIVGIQFVK